MQTIVGFQRLLDRWRLAGLKHVVRPLPNGGMVLVLDTGAIINSEAEAMLQALHSRSTGGIYSHLKVLAERGSTNFMRNFYVGYNHKSIGDCGSVTIFIEGVSLLAAKAIQDWMLYAGAESSTRFLDYAKQPFLDPLGTNDSFGLLENWRCFYLQALKPLQEYLRQQFPKTFGDPKVTYEKAIAAQSFDILRGFLPAATCTNLSWHTNLRQAADHLMYLRHHPLVEVRIIAKTIESALQEAYPSSFSHKRHQATEEFNAEWMKQGYYYSDSYCPDFSLAKDEIDISALIRYREFLKKRPARTELPKAIAECGTLQFRFLLDFGSFRDLQRHRAVILRMPLLTFNHGFERWYLNELPPALKKQAIVLLRGQRETLSTFNAPAEIQQYYLPMGYRVPVSLTGDLSALVYLIELRSTRFVHPTLRHRALQMAAALDRRFSPYGLQLHLDKAAQQFDVERGTHDIALLA